MSLQKIKPWRSKKYIAYIKTLDCVVTGRPAGDAHHIIGLKESGTSTKVDDFYCIPLTRAEHRLLHVDFKKWEEKNGSQIFHWRKTIARAIRDSALPGFEMWSDGL